MAKQGKISRDVPGHLDMYCRVSMLGGAAVDLYGINDTVKPALLKLG